MGQNSVSRAVQMDREYALRAGVAGAANGPGVSIEFACKLNQAGSAAQSIGG